MQVNRLKCVFPHFGALFCIAGTAEAQTFVGLWLGFAFRVRMCEVHCFEGSSSQEKKWIGAVTAGGLSDAAAIRSMAQLLRNHERTVQ